MLHAQLGDGGQAKVYLASRKNELFAVKVYKPEKHHLETIQTDAF